jgi:chromosome segregation protein
MLKALELTGFKSFADKTRFEFPDGITVVVGPNGSGKSNIVDGIKWVLGEQSAKSLRGKEMADVIFKGTGGTGGRKEMNCAEATVIFDNSQQTFPVDAPEVHVTRRVYRSGESEYLINGKPCRLKDIRDMLRGTGVGVDAYSLIEQGKVDRLLQASSKDRRAIFEEAAGISRFKAKKIEAQRRLERVDQNLLRLSDIVEEVESRLRSVRAQASKAQRYREFTNRLQQLRTQVGVADWRRLSEKLGAIEAELAASQQQITAASAESETLEQELRELTQAADHAAEELRQRETELAGNREQIAARQQLLADSRTRCSEFQEEADRHRQRFRSTSHRVGNLQDRLQSATAELAEAERIHAEIRQRVAQHEQAANDLSRHLQRVTAENEARRTQHMERMRAASVLGNRVSGQQSQLAAEQAAISRAAGRLQELADLCAGHAQRLQDVQAQEAGLAAELAQQTAELESSEVQFRENRRGLARRQQELTVLQGRHAGATQRADVLEQLERESAGLTAGVQDLLQEARQQCSGSGDAVHGIVADLIEAGVEVAPLIDTALGDTVQHIVVSGERLIKRVQSGDYRPTGRVAIIRLDAFQAAPPVLLGPLVLSGRGDLQGRPGVIGRADRLVRTAEPFEELIDHLLGDTWLVDTLQDALTLSRTVGRGFRFVTSRGELLEADGTLVIGPPQATIGLVSRRSELRALREEIRDLDARIRQFEQEIGRLQENLDVLDRRNKQLADSCRRTETALNSHQARTQTLLDQQRSLEQERAALEAELGAARQRHDAVHAQWEGARRELEETESAIRQLEEELGQGEQRSEQIRDRLKECNTQLTQAQVELAKSEQRVDNLRMQMTEFESVQRERSRAIAEVQTQLRQAIQRRDQAEMHVLRLTSELAVLYLRREQVMGQVGDRQRIRQQINRERGEMTAALDKLRQRLRRLEEQQHKQQLAAGEVQHERTTLAGRLREDYGIEIGQIDQLAESPEQEQQRAQVEAEISDLRDKINRIGAVNVDALDELDDLDQRYQSMSSQYKDLTQAKESLERIINKINADSRRLFMETLEAIRGNFQTLYRKAFGGGRADLTLEEGKDVLECGVDIFATPPGKPSFNNSLLSGGEKALTAMALLLAIFKFRPSPFCILDEVDAPFDEANIGRFVDVLRDFLDSTKFVIVTHSKKTMTAATTLYGVTMQESGVSKRVSVRFEDVSEDGHISLDAVRRAEADPQDDERAA